MAILAAKHLHAPQARLFVPNGILVIVVGCGRHGINIAGELLRRGCHVKLCDADPGLARQRYASLVRLIRATAAPPEPALIVGDE